MELRLSVDDQRFLVHDGNEVHLLYLHRSHAGKPVVVCLRGPSGRNMLEESPADHAHHHGIWWGHGDVNGVDFYLEVDAPGRRRGTIEHVGYTRLIDEPPAFGFTEQLAWRDPAGATLVEEERRLDARLDDGCWSLDLDSTYVAMQDLELGDTKESVLPALRLAEALTEMSGGCIVASHGGRGEAAVMGQPAEWVDYHGNRTAVYAPDPVTEGLAVMSHPGNPDHPPRFFARGYGPLSPHEGNYFIGPERMEAGESLRLRYRVLVHRGDDREANVAARYAAYCDQVPAAVAAEGRL